METQSREKLFNTFLQTEATDKLMRKGLKKLRRQLDNAEKQGKPDAEGIAHYARGMTIYNENAAKREALIAQLAKP